MNPDKDQSGTNFLKESVHLKKIEDLLDSGLPIDDLIRDLLHSRRLELQHQINSYLIKNKKSRLRLIDLCCE